MHSLAARFAVPLIGLMVAACAAANTGATGDAALDRDSVDRFVDEMHREHGFDTQALHGLFAATRRVQAIIDAISKPAEAMPWYRYRPIFITPERIEAGVAFLHDHRELLDRAQETYGVDPAIIVAIIGVETYYGRKTGSYRVLDALATLAFHYPKRAGFFRGELEHFLLLTRDQGLDPLSLTGSYAGAMGIPQFMPGSYRHYAVDFDGDRHIDIWTNPADAVGSVASYLKAHGWRRGEAIAAPAQVPAAGPGEWLAADLKPVRTYGQFAAAGIVAEPALAAGDRVALIGYETADGGREYWFGRENFYAITRYNRSPLYALAVVQLAGAIRDGGAPAAPMP